VLPETSELPWLQQSIATPGATIITNPKKGLLSENAAESISDTRELRRNWEQGVFTINTRSTQAATGWIGGTPINLSDMDATIVTPSATVVVQSLDGHAISESRSIAIALGARAIPQSGNSLPFFAEPVIGQLSVRAPKGLRLYRNCAPTGTRRVIPVPYRTAVITFAWIDSLERIG